ncbi:MAG: hypothetical protein ACHRHE_11035 [Tepidisphaerales bacterium]
MMTFRPPRILWIALALAAASGCNHQPQPPAKNAPAEPAPAARAGGGEAPDATAGANEVIVTQEAPKTWQLDPTPRQMREMTYAIGEGEKAAAVIVSKLPETTYTNDPLSNINRWRTQVALPPLTDIAQQKMEKVKIGSADGTLLDLAGVYNRHLILAMLRRNGAIWYFKLLGHHETVAAERKGLESFLASVKFGPPAAGALLAGTNPPGPALPSGHPPTPGNPSASMPEGHVPVGGGNAAVPARTPGLSEFKAAATWKQDPERRPMRELTYNIGEEPKGAVVIVSRLPAETFTSNPLPNINRWRDQVGLGPVEDLAGQPSQKVIIGGETGSIYDLTGPQRGRQIVALVTRGGEIWYFKIIGSAETIDTEKANFEAFLASVKFAAEK